METTAATFQQRLAITLIASVMAARGQLTHYRLARNCGGRPVREPPILDYSQCIGEEYEKKKEAMLKYLDNDAGERMTAVMDLDTEFDLLHEYHH